MPEPWAIILALAAGTFAVRLSGIALGRRLPEKGAWARGLNALSGCLIVSLVAVGLLSGGAAEWLAALAAAAVAIITHNLPLTMAAGISTVWLLRWLI